MKYIRTFESFCEEDFELTNEEINWKNAVIGLAIAAKVLMPGSASAQNVKTQLDQKPQVVQTINTKLDYGTVCLSIFILNQNPDIMSDIDFRPYINSTKEYMVMVENDVDQSSIKKTLGDKYENSKRLAENIYFMSEQIIKEKGKDNEQVKKNINDGYKIIQEIEGTIRWDGVSFINEM
jgi:hypothetical protein